MKNKFIENTHYTGIKPISGKRLHINSKEETWILTAKDYTDQYFRLHWTIRGGIRRFFKMNGITAHTFPDMTMDFTVQQIMTKRKTIKIRNVCLWDEEKKKRHMLNVMIARANQTK